MRGGLIGNETHIVNNNCRPYGVIGIGVLCKLLKGHFTHMKLFFKITEIETLINITYIVRFLRSTDVSVFYY